MESLTDEQRLLIEANRRAALEKCRDRRNKTVEKENNRDDDRSSRVAASNHPSSQSNSCDNDVVASSASIDYNNLSNNNAGSNRKSFGDSGIDWSAAVGEIDRVAQSHHFNSTTTTAAAPIATMSSLANNNDVDVRRKRKIEDQQQQQQLTEEQRIRMENNRRRAMEKKQQQQQQIMNNNSNDAIMMCSTTLPSISTGEQRARIEENRRKALEKKQSSSSVSSIPPNRSNDQHHIQLTNNNLTQEQLARREQNKHRALEKKNQAQQQQQQQQQGRKQPDSIVTSFSSPQKPAALTEEQKLRMEQNRLKALQKKQLSSSSLSKSSSDSNNDNITAVAAASKQDLPTNKPAAPIKKTALPPLYSEIQYDPSRILPINDDDTDTLIENAELDKLLLNGWTLYDHQKEGVLRALRMRRLILAFDMGLGKTIIGCVWAKAFLRTFEGIKIFVIAPVSLHEDWRRTATNASGLKVDSGQKTTKKVAVAKKKDSNSEEYYATGKKRKSKKKKEDDDEDSPHDDSEPDIYIYSWSTVSASKEVVKKCSEYVVICDEAHNMQSMSSQRTKDALKLMFPKYCRGALLLSGTPMKNGRPSNLFPLLTAVNHPFGDHQMRYETFFCDGQQRNLNGKDVWLATGSSNLRELNAHTASHIFRMTKEECMSNELPPRKRELRNVPVGPLQQQRYTQALKDLAKAFTTSHSIGGRDGEDILTPFNKLRQISSFAKVDAAVSIANAILNEESSIVVFTSFVDVAKQIHQKLEGMDWTGELLTGETPTKKRQSMVDNFQSGLSPVFVCTYGAGGVGLTLTAACTVILVDRPWTPGDVSQAEDRVRRIGQKRPVRSIWVRAFPIDEQIDQLLDHKDVTSNTVVDGKASTGQSRSAPKVKISELIKTVIDTK